MLTAHECIRVLRDMREAAPLVRYRWPHTPEDVQIEAGPLSISLSRNDDKDWFGWAMLSWHTADSELWPQSLDDRFHAEVDAALARAGIDGAVRRPMLCGLPF